MVIAERFGGQTSGQNAVAHRLAIQPDPWPGKIYCPAPRPRPGDASQSGQRSALCSRWAPARRRFVRPAHSMRRFWRFNDDCQSCGLPALRCALVAGDRFRVKGVRKNAPNFVRTMTTLTVASACLRRFTCIAFLAMTPALPAVSASAYGRSSFD